MRYHYDSLPSHTNMVVRNILSLVFGLIIGSTSTILFLTSVPDSVTYICRGSVRPKKPVMRRAPKISSKLPGRIPFHLLFPFPYVYLIFLLPTIWILYALRTSGKVWSSWVVSVLKIHFADYYSLVNCFHIILSSTIPSKCFLYTPYYWEVYKLSRFLSMCYHPIFSYHSLHVMCGDTVTV